MVSGVGTGGGTNCLCWREGGKEGGRGEAADTHLVSCHIEPSDNDKPTLSLKDAN